MSYVLQFFKSCWQRGTSQCFQVKVQYNENWLKITFIILLPEKSGSPLPEFLVLLIKDFKNKLTRKLEDNLRVEKEQPQNRQAPNPSMCLEEGAREEEEGKFCWSFFSVRYGGLVSRQLHSKKMGVGHSYSERVKRLKEPEWACLDSVQHERKRDRRKSKGEVTSVWGQVDLTEPHGGFPATSQRAGILRKEKT